jgi:hypothetical protein
MTIDQRATAFIDTVETLPSGTTAVMIKPTRAGATWAIAQFPELTGNRIVVVEPTNAICKVTIQEASKGAAKHIPSNINCPVVAESHKNKNLPNFRPVSKVDKNEMGELTLKCNGELVDCPYISMKEGTPFCGFQDAGYQEQYGITYAKLEATFNSTNNMFRKKEPANVKRISEGIDVIFFDEIQSIITPPAAIDISKKPYECFLREADAEGNRISNAMMRLSKFNSDVEQVITRGKRAVVHVNELEDKLRDIVTIIDHAGQIPDPMFVKASIELQENNSEYALRRYWDDTNEDAENAFIKIHFNNPFMLNTERKEDVNLLAELRKVIEEVDIEKEFKTDYFNRLITILNLLKQPEFTFTTMTTTDDQGKVKVSYLLGPKYNPKEAAVKELIYKARKSNPDLKVVLVSATPVEPYPGYWEKLTGANHVIQIALPDVKKTNSKMTIINIPFAKVSKGAWLGAGIGFKNTKQANKLKEDVCNKIVEIRNNEKQPVYVITQNIMMAKDLTWLLKGKGLKVRGECADFDAFVDYYRSSDSIGVANDLRVGIAVGISRSPSKLQDSICRNGAESRQFNDRMNDAATWQGWSRIKDPGGKQESRLYVIGVPTWEVVNALTWGDYQIPAIKEMATKIDTLHKNPQTIGVGEYIERMSPLLAETGVDATFPGLTYNILSVLDVFPGKSASTSEIKCSSSSGECQDNIKRSVETAMRYFISNKKVVSVQQADGSYRPSKNFAGRKSLEALIEAAFSGQVTIACYSGDENGCTNHVAFDIDGHGTHSENSRERVFKIKSVLQRWGIGFVLEASWSPDSYHIWIPLAKPFPLKLAKSFATAVVREAGVDVEYYPKQANIKKLGNALKIPGVINRKTRVRSHFLDPETLAPLDSVTIESALLLRDPIKDVEVVSGFPVYTTLSEPSIRVARFETKFKDIRPCLRALLDNKVCLEGELGHNARVAIASDALKSGMSSAEVAAMFSGQPDYDFDYSLYQVEHIRDNGYSYSCRGLRDQVGVPLTMCTACPYAHPERNEDVQKFIAATV